MKNIKDSEQGLTLIEILVAGAILVFTMGGLTQMYINSSHISALAGNTSLVINQASSKLEEIRNHEYPDIVADYSSGGTPGNTFNITGLTGKGVIYINSTHSNRLKIDVVISWRNEDGRIFGEDVNFNGTLDAGEDTDGDARISSPLTSVSTYLARR